MSKLIIRRGITKLAAAEDGPTFEQQFGIMANAQITTQYPKLDQMKLAFQLIDKAEDNSSAVGTLVYLVGNSVIFIPAFYRNGKLDTGDMMFLASTQQFLPLSDPWLAWVQNKELPSAGSLVPQETLDNSQLTNAVTIREITDPILKTACEAGYAYLKGLTRTARSMDDVMKIDSGVSVLDTALKMGKTASETLLDKFIGDTDYLNAALRFYKGDEIDSFAKQAAELGREPEDTVKVILPFTKEASELTPEENEVLMRDGYIIKTAAADVPKVVFRKSRIKDSFKKVSAPGKKQMLLEDGRVKECLVLRHGDSFGGACRDCCCYDSDIKEGLPPNGQYSTNPGDDPRHVMKDVKGSKGLVAVVTQDADTVVELPEDVMGMNRQENDDFKADDIKDYGRLLTPSGVSELKWDDWVLCPDGTAYRINGDYYAKGNGWNSMGSWHSSSIAIAEDASQKTPIVYKDLIVLPQKSRIVQSGRNNSTVPVDESIEKVKAEEKREAKAKPRFVTWSTFEHFLGNYERKNYRSVKVTMRGNDVHISDDTDNNGDKVLSIKEASLYLVKEHGVEPGMARGMIADCMAKSPTGIAAETYLIDKQAAKIDEPQEANIGAHTFTNVGPIRNLVEMPSDFERPENLEKAVTMAAEQGIKDVFDVTTFKLLVRQNRFLEEIQDDIPLLMRVLDSLCRKLFLLYCHTEDFEHQYGTVKLKSLEESLKNTLDSMSDLTIFFKMRTASTDVTTGQDGGELMRGYDL